MEEFDDFIDLLADHLGLEEEGGGGEEEEEEEEEEEKEKKESPAVSPAFASISSLSSPEPKKRKERERENQSTSGSEISEEEADFGLRKSANVVSSSASSSIPATFSRSTDAAKKASPSTGGGFSLIEFQFNKLSGGKGYLDLPDLTGWVFIQVRLGYRLGVMCTVLNRVHFCWFWCQC